MHGGRRRSRAAGQASFNGSPASCERRGDPYRPLPKIMYFVYLLRSKKDNGFYIGFTSRDTQERLVEHQNGIVDSTKNRRPVELVYFEAYREESLARVRERNLKDFGSAYVALLKRLGFK